jgi:hypothetical protein
MARESPVTGVTVFRQHAAPGVGDETPSGGTVLPSSCRSLWKTGTLRPITVRIWSSTCRFGLLLMKTSRLIPFCLGLLVLTSCVDEPGDAKAHLQQARKTASEYGKKVREDVDSLVAIKAKVEALIPAIEEKDFEKLKTVCTELDVLLDTDVLGAYYRTFAIEVKSGPAAAKQYLAEKLSDSTLGDEKQRPLRALNAYFDAKGTVSTKDAALTILAILLEVKFPHGRGAVLVVPFMDDPGSGFGTGRPPDK